VRAFPSHLYFSRQALAPGWGEWRGKSGPGSRYCSSVQNDRREGKRPEYPIASVDNALKLVAILAERQRLRVSDAAAALGTARSTAHRLLAMLEYHRFARQDAATRAYLPGPALVEAGLAALASLDVRVLARPVLERLADETGETVHLVVLEGTAAVFLDSVESSKALRIGSRIGWHMPAHCTASGKALLAQLTPTELRRLYPDDRLERMTPASPSTFQELEAQLDAVREHGYATNLGESEAEVAAVAVALPPGRTDRPASLTISAPLVRLEQSRIPGIAAAAKRAVGTLDVTSMSHAAS
jgi:DNA-binding IclR family transcriptional regulator